MARSARPNIAVILVDQLRADILSAYGGGICHTPAIDAFARGAMVFERAYTTLAVCSPARASLLTGQYPHKHGVVANASPLSNGVLADSPRLMSRRLEAAGYERWYCGKWHLGEAGNLPADLGLPGQQFPGHGEGGYALPQYRRYLQDKGLPLRFADGPHQLGWHRYGVLDGPEETEVSAFVADDAIGFLDGWAERRDRPFFLWVNFWGPHEPYFPTAGYLALYDGVEIPPWPNFPDHSERRPRIHDLKIPPESREAGWAFWEPAVRHYFAFMSLIDHQIGRILDRLAALGGGADTLVIFAADHGESIGAHGLQDKGHFMYEETQRIPLMIALPGAAAGRDSHLVSLADLYPTVMELALGGPDDFGDTDGRSLVPLLARRPTAWRETLTTEFHGLVTPFTQRMMVNDRYKYVWNMGDRDELYDLATDPYELDNRIEDAALAPLCRQLHEALLDWMRETRDPAIDYFARHVENSRMR